jgi:hypothetical protein
MKKQILILAMVLTTICISTTYGQMVHNSDPQPLSCTPDPLHPTAGVPFNYAALVTPNGGNFQWWATKDVNFIAATANNMGTRLTVGAGLPLSAASASYGTTSATNNVDITWSAATLAGTTAASPTFVVVQYDATGTNCANNLKVYQIAPVNAFIVDIKNMDQTKISLAYSTPYSLCVSNIASAKYDAPTKAIVTDYGNNVLYFEVVAANFSGGYIPSFKVTGLSAGQTVAALDLFVDPAFATAPIATTVTAGVYSPAAALTSTAPTTANGVSVYARLTIANGTHENLNDDNITLAVNGTDMSGQNSVDNTKCDTPSNFDDTATQTLTRRPTVTAAVVTVPFVTP